MAEQGEERVLGAVGVFGALASRLLFNQRRAGALDLLRKAFDRFSERLIN